MNYLHDIAAVKAIANFYQNLPFANVKVGDEVVIGKLQSDTLVSLYVSDETVTLPLGVVAMIPVIKSGAAPVEFVNILHAKFHPSTRPLGLVLREILAHIDVDSVEQWSRFRVAQLVERLDPNGNPLYPSPLYKQRMPFCPDADKRRALYLELVAAGTHDWVTPDMALKALVLERVPTTVTPRVAY